MLHGVHGAVPVCTRRSGARATARPRPPRAGDAPSSGSAHGLLAVDGLADDVGVAGVLGGLGHDVQEHAPGRARRARREPRRRAAAGATGRGRAATRPARRCARPPARSAARTSARVSPGSSRNSSAHSAPRRSGRLAVRDAIASGRCSMKSTQLRLGRGDVLDQPAEAELAGRRGRAGLLVGQALDGVTQEVAVRCAGSPGGRPARR